MSAYVATARIRPVAPRLVIGRAVDSDLGVRTVAPDPDELVTEVDVQDPFVERVTAARERWAQLTFYLFDPESWR
jgi:hypothetical protein